MTEAITLFEIRISMKFFLLLLSFVGVRSFAQTNSTYHYYPPVQLNDGLQTASLPEVGIDSNKIVALTNKILSGQYTNIHSLLILRHNKLVYENYFAGPDQMIVFGSDDKSFVRTGSIDPFNHPADSLHDVRSISKSIVSACIGITLAQRKIKSVDQNIWTYFPEYHSLDTGLKSTITIRNLLTMTSGLDLNEKVPYSDSANTENQMNRSADPIGFVLSRQSVHPPGIYWNYSGGCTEILAAIIQKTSGLELDKYANQYLFKPLGITNFQWVRLPSTPMLKGVPAAASGLRLNSRDMLKIGLLYINNGKWKNKQVIPVNWIRETLQFYFTTDFSETYYGYQFWGTDVDFNNSKVKAFAAMGNGGQLIVIMPTLKVIIVVTAGNYGTELGAQSYEMVASEIYPAIEIKKSK
jgi:CubicO group peptidase (beta-lactamase class C family)